MKKLTFIWDLDGTLIDSYDIITSCLKQIYEERGVSISQEEILKDVLNESVSAFIVKMENKFGVPFSDLKDRYSLISHKETMNIKAMKHAKEILEYLKQNNIPNYIFTHRGVTTEPVLKNLGLLDYFDEIVNSQSGYGRKPDPAGLNYLIDKYHLDKENTYYVGDRPLDIECANNAHVKSIMYIVNEDIVKPTGKETYAVKDLMDIKYIVSDDRPYYRLAKMKDIDSIMEAVEDSRELLKEQGNGQWQDGYPNRDDFINDIKNKRLFVVFDEDDVNKVAGVCALTYREEDYHHLYEGKWLTELPYMVMHRVALKKEYRHQGYGKKLFKVFIEQAKLEGYRSLRIDTHEGNAVMRHLITSFGFVYCGKAILTPDKDRMVFERVFKEEECLRLELPSEKYFPLYKDMVRQNDFCSPQAEKIFDASDNALEKMENYRLGINLKPGYVAATTLWLVDDKELYGQINIRHQLTKALLNFGGTIGYGIKYSKRGHGYGKLMLKLCLDYCRDVLNMSKVMITCDYDNYASEGVMLANGAKLGEILDNPDLQEGHPKIKKYWIDIKPYIVENNRFYLREITEDDYQAMSDIFQDAENMKFFGAPYDDKKMRRLMDWTFNNYKKYGYGFWAIIDKSSGLLVGDCGLTMQKIDDEWLPEIGYHLNKKYHGLGYASEAAQLVKEYIFRNYAFDELYSYTFEKHFASMKVMERNGMTFKKMFSEDGDNYVVYSVKRK